MDKNLETPLDRIKAAAKEGRKTQKWRKGGQAARKRAEELERKDPYMVSLRFTNSR